MIELRGKSYALCVCLVVIIILHNKYNAHLVYYYNYAYCIIIIHSEGIPVKPQTLPASLVLSSQIAGYSGGKVDSNATVDITFPIKVYESSFSNY